MKRVWVAGILAGVAVFVFSAILHMATPVGGLVIAALQRSK